jgi:hypothetical protein
MDRIHIYVLSKLAVAGAGGWKRIMKKAKDERRPRFWTYRPLRRAVVESLKREPGANTGDLEQSIEREAGKATREGCVEANLRAFQTFQEQFREEFARFEEDLMDPNWRGCPVEMAGAELVGDCHLAATDRRGVHRLVYLHPSRDWRDEEIDAFLELLVYIGGERHGAKARQVWFLDLWRGKKTVLAHPRKRVLRKCEEAIELLATMPEM